ncbi:unnamed protein product [Schistosoma turkestanicum]|nr:unnamed protein product [Schistosoma turkestanicum]
MCADIVEDEDSDKLTKVSSCSLTDSQIYQLLYSSIVNKNYDCLECYLKHSHLDFYEPFEADGLRLPLLYHAIRLGNLDACKLLVKHGLNPLICIGICQQNETKFNCEDILQFTSRFTSNSTHHKTIAFLFQIVLYLVEACHKSNADESIEQWLPSIQYLQRIHCTIKKFASRQCDHHIKNLSNSFNHLLSINHVVDNVVIINKPSTIIIHQQPLTHRISSKLKNFLFTKRLSLLKIDNESNQHYELMMMTEENEAKTPHVDKEEGDEEQQKQQLLSELLSSSSSEEEEELMLRWNSDDKFKLCHLLSVVEFWEWARNQVKPLLLICVQNNYIKCLDKLLQIGFQIIPIHCPTSISSTSEQVVELLNFNQQYSKSNHALNIFIEDMNSVQKQHHLWIESICANQQQSAIHAAVQFNKLEALKLIIQWEPNSLAVTIGDNNQTMGILPIHIACALNHLDCLKLMLNITIPPTYHFESIHTPDQSIETKQCSLFSCRINESPALYQHYFCIDQLDSYNMTGFLLAVLHSHVEIIHYLLNYTVKAKKLTINSPVALIDSNMDMNSDQLHSTIHDNDDQDDNDNSCDHLNVTDNEQSPFIYNYSNNPMSYDICPIDIYRKIAACWYFATSMNHTTNNTKNSSNSSNDCTQRPMIIINPRYHQSLNVNAICGYFNALQLSIMTGNIESISMLVTYLHEEINTGCTSCIHGQCYNDHLLNPMMTTLNNANSNHLQSITITTPLGLTCCCLAEIDENKAVEIASILLNYGAVDVDNQLFVYTMKKSFHKLAGLLFIHELLLLSLKSLENHGTLNTMTKHLNLSNMSLFQSSIMTKTFWFVNSMLIIPQWMKLLEELSKFNGINACELASQSPSSSPSAMSSVQQKESNMNKNTDTTNNTTDNNNNSNNNGRNHQLYQYISQLLTLSIPSPLFSRNFSIHQTNQLITRITLSNCGLQTLPWCLFNCVKNLKELDLSKNHIRSLPKQLPNVPMAYRPGQYIPTCWTSSLIYLDLSENQLDYLPKWLFVNKCDYQSGKVSFSSKRKSKNYTTTNNDDNSSLKQQDTYVLPRNTDIIDSYHLRRCYSEPVIMHTAGSSLHPKTMMMMTTVNDSFAPNLLHLLLSRNQLRVLPAEIWTGSLWCKLQFLDLSWNKISCLPVPNLLKLQFDHSQQMYKDSLCRKKTQSLQTTHEIHNTTQFGNNAERLQMDFNSENIFYFPTNQLLTRITNLNQPVEKNTSTTNTTTNNNISSNDEYNDKLFEKRKPVEFFDQYEYHTSHLTHLWLHHNCLKSLRLVNPTNSSMRKQSTPSGLLEKSINLAKICPNLIYLDVSYNALENFSDLFLCPKLMNYIDLSYNQMKLITSRYHYHRSYHEDSDEGDDDDDDEGDDVQLSSSSPMTISCPCCCDKNTFSNSNQFTCNYFTKLEHLNLRGNQFHIFSCCYYYYYRYTKTMRKLNQFKIFNESQLFQSSPFDIQRSLSSSSSSLTNKSHGLLFPALKSLDLSENPNLKYICPSLLGLMHLQYLSLDHCTSLNELPGDLYRLSNLQNILLNKTPFMKYLAPIIDPTLKFNQYIGMTNHHHHDNAKNDVNDYPNLNEPIYTPRIVSYLKSITDQSNPFTRFRVMVVGPTGVGKTTLVRLLKASESAGESFCRNNSNENPLKTADMHTSSSSTSPTLQSIETDHHFMRPDQLVPSVQITNLTINRPDNKNQSNQSINSVNVSSRIINNKNANNNNNNNTSHFHEQLLFSIWDIEKNNMKIINRSNIPSTSSPSSTTDNDNIMTSSLSSVSSDLACPSEILIHSQLGIHCELTIYLVVWRTTDGLLGLNRITPWLMKIKVIYIHIFFGYRILCMM